MEQRDQGIIVRVQPLTETSLIVHWITAGHGHIATIARGARRPKSSFAGKLDLYFQAQIVYAESRRSDLHQLREVVVGHLRLHLRQDIEALRCAAYAAALIDRIAERQTPIPGLYRLLRDLLDGHFGPLSTGGAWPITVFEWGTLADQGLAPAIPELRCSLGSRSIIQVVLAALAQAAPIPNLKPSQGQLKEIAALSKQALTGHVGQLPRGRP